MENFNAYSNTNNGLRPGEYGGNLVIFTLNSTII